MKPKQSIQQLLDEKVVTAAENVFAQKEKQMAEDIFEQVLEKRWEDFMKEE